MQSPQSLFADTLNIFLYFHFVKFILILIIPCLLLSAQSLDESVSYLSTYILSDDFKSIRDTVDDIKAIDILYKEALSYHDGDISEALLAVSFSTLAFQKLPLKIPLIDIQLNFPLLHVDPKLFREKISLLPKQIFFNSPSTKFGDKDKIAHFFGSAYLANSVTIFNLSKFMGIFIELFESTFKVEGSLDYRDMMVNELGEFFGNALNENPNLLPSQALQYYNLFYFRITN